MLWRLKNLEFRQRWINVNDLYSSFCIQYQTVICQTFLVPQPLLPLPTLHMLKSFRTIPSLPPPNQTVPNPCFRLLVFFYGVWGSKVKGKGLCSTLQSPQSKGERATPVHPLGKNIPSPPASSSDQALNQRKRRRRRDLIQTTLVPYLYRVSHNTY